MDPVVNDEPSERAAEAAGEPAAWAEVQARWEEPAAHLAYLARFPDLDGLTTAGRRYREALAARPGDTVALAMKAEILKRATVVGLSMLPKAAPSPLAGGKSKRWAIVALAIWIGSTLGTLLWKWLAG
jgi:hypothetical protein